MNIMEDSLAKAEKESTPRKFVTITVEQEKKYHSLMRAEEERERGIKRNAFAAVRPAASIRYNWLINLIVNLNGFLNDVITRSREKELARAYDLARKGDNVS